MSLGLAVFGVVAFATLFNNAPHHYTRVQTYPLFAWVGRDEFVPFHREYQRRLPAEISAPYSLLMACNTLLLFFRPARVPVWSVVVILILNAFRLAAATTGSVLVAFLLFRLLAASTLQIFRKGTPS